MMDEIKGGKDNIQSYGIFKHLNQRSTFTVKGRVRTRWPKHSFPPLPLSSGVFLKWSNA